MLIVKKEFFDLIIKHCLKEFPNEACGLLAGKEGKVEKLYETLNVDKSPESFLMEPKEQLKITKEIRNLGLEMIGIYHSHVASEAYPSEHDLQLAFYPEVSYAIVTLKDKNNPKIRSFKIVEGRISEEEVKIE